jgi:ketosteroid isomerase-like protein
MGKWLGVFLLGSICVLLGACAHVEGHSHNDLKARVDILGNQAEKAFLSGNIDAMLEFYCDDVVSMPNFHPLIKGKADLKRQTEAIIASGLKFESLESTTVDVQSGGEYIYEIGTFSQIIMPNSGKPVESAGKYVTIWRKQPDGSLKIAVEIYNSDVDS